MFRWLQQEGNIAEAETEYAPMSGLAIIADELMETLRNAHLALEDCVDGRGGSAALVRAGELLHQVRGALQMTETYGAALLTEEMELGCKYLAGLRAGKGREDGLDALTRAMVQLPVYIERLLGGGRDIALVLLPMLNDLRAARDAAQAALSRMAGTADRAGPGRSAWIVGIANMIFLGLTSIIFIAVPDAFIGFFIDPVEEPLVMSSGITCLRVVSFGFLVYALGQVMVNSINGAGDTATPVWINFIAFWLMEIPLAYVFTNVMELHIRGVCYAILIGEAALTFIALAIFKRGRWKLKKV